jgi:hypothetical protein
MITKKAIAAALISLSTLSAVPANAGGLTVEFGFNPGYGWSGGRSWQHERLSAQQVRSILRHRGYRQIDFVDRGGRTYEVTARRDGRKYYIVVSAFSGDIVHRHRI